MTTIDERELIHDWNEPYFELTERIQFDDETLRDGLQSPSAKEPTLDEKVELIHLMNELGIDTADVGLPGASQHARDHIAFLCKEMEKLTITPNVACRTLVSDIEPVVDLVQEIGSPVEVCAFVGSSAIRMFAEGWEFDKVLGFAKSGVEFAAKNDLPVMFVTEDTARAKPAEVEALYRTAIEAGARRVCICDTCGHITPEGTRALVITEQNGKTKVQVTGIVRAADGTPKDLTVPMTLLATNDPDQGVWVDDSTVAVMKGSPSEAVTPELLFLTASQPQKLAPWPGLTALSAGNGGEEIYAQSTEGIFQRIGNGWSPQLKGPIDPSYPG